MVKKTVAQVDAELQQLKYDAGNVQLAQFTCWNWEQVAVELEAYDRYGELIKMEVTKDWSTTDKRCYHVYVWHRPLLNIDDRRWKGGDHYEALRQTAQFIIKDKA